MEYSRHALARMQQRHISPAEAYAAIRRGYRQGDGRGHLRCAWRDVVVIVEPRQRLVVPAWRRG